MAQQLHYTSAATGLSGRPGFQFVAASPAATNAMQQAVAPYLAYRPPPSAPSQPTPAQLASFPISYSFVCRDATAILTQCRYLGTDYSGRYGNFLGHAVVAQLAELGERPPIALWGSPIWAAEPAEPPLPELAALPSGEGLDEPAVAGWLASHGGYDWLAGLIEAVLASLAGRAGQVILVATEVETVAKWIAAISYSLPLAWAQRLSFVTYTGDVNRAQQHLVGTTADAWTGGSHGQVFRLDQPATNPAEAGAYARGLAAAWRQHDRYQREVLNELVVCLAADGDGMVVPDRDVAATLAAVCRGDRLPAESMAAVADLLTRCGDRLPPWVWDDLGTRLAAGGEPLNFDLTLAIHEAARRVGQPDLADQAGAAAVRLAIGQPRQRPRLAAVRLPATTAAGLAGELAPVLSQPPDLAELDQLVREMQRLAIPLDLTALQAGTSRAVAAGGGRVSDLLRAAPQPVQWAAVLQGVVDGLAHADQARIAEQLTSDVCDLLAGRDWDSAPRVGAHVLASRGRRDPASQEPATTTIADLTGRGLLPDQEMGRRLREIWRTGVPSLTLCQRLLAGVTNARQAQLRGVVALARTGFVTGDLATPAAYEVAKGLIRLLGRNRTDPAVADAMAVIAVHQAASRDAAAYTDLQQVEGVAEAAVFRRAAAAVAKTYPAAFAGADARTKAEVLRQTPSGEVRRDLVDTLIEAADQQARGAAVDLAHVAAVLWHAGVPDKRLTAKAAKLLRRPDTARKVKAGLQNRDAKLRGWFDHMIKHHDQGLLQRITRPWRV